MGFNAGGVNVTGVESLEPGVLTATSVNTAFSVADGIYTSIVVPAGEKWIVKGSSVSSGTFAGTMTSIAFLIEADGRQVAIDNVSGTSTTYQYLTETILTLAPGDRLRVKTSASVYTSGQLIINFLYQKVSI